MLRSLMLLGLLVVASTGAGEQQRSLSASWFDVRYRVPAPTPPLPTSPPAAGRWGSSLANVTIDEACEAKNYAKCIEYEAQALIYTLQGLVNRDAPRSAESPAAARHDTTT